MKIEMEVHSVDLRKEKTVLQAFPSDKEQRKTLGCTILDMPAHAVPNVRPGSMITVEILEIARP